MNETQLQISERKRRGLLEWLKQEQGRRLEAEAGRDAAEARIHEMEETLNRMTTPNDAE